MSRQKKDQVDAGENHEDILKSMTKEGGVRGWIVVNWEGIPVKYQVNNHIYDEVITLKKKK